jgi:O-succinylbenzoic acid--CoA ligase
MTKVNWLNETSYLFTNPTLDKDFVERLTHFIFHTHNFKNHIFILTSGTSASAAHISTLKVAALPKEGFLLAAKAVNEHIRVTKEDTWGNILPPFHVGSLSMFARAFLASTPIIDLYDPFQKWDPFTYTSLLEKHHITLTSLVPTQVYDLVTQGIKAPISLRVVFVGGGYLSKSLYERALSLGWPLLPTYGMTEACSQIATFPLEGGSWEQETFPRLKILNHTSLQLDPLNQTFTLKSPSLLSFYILWEKNAFTLFDPKKGDRLETTDQGELLEEELIVTGRQDEVVKILGENVSLLHLQNKLEELALALKVPLHSLALIPLEHERRGCELVLVSSGSCEKTLEFFEIFNSKVQPFERLARVFFLDHLPKSSLDKIKKNEIKMLIK